MPREPTGDGLSDGYRPTVAPPYFPVVVSPDEVKFRSGPWSGPTVTLTDTDADGRLGDLPALLSGELRLDELTEEFDPVDGDELRSVLRRLATEGIVSDAGDTADDQLAGYRSVDRTMESGAQIDGSVLVVGDGAIGRMVAADLAHTSEADISLLRSSNSDPFPDGAGIDELPPETPLEAGIPDAEYVVHATDRPTHQTGRRINDLAHEAGVPWISGRLWGLDGQVGPTVLPGRSACYECFFRRALGSMNAADASNSGSHAVPPSATPRPLRPHARIIAGWLATDLLRMMANGTGITVGGVVHFDFHDMTVEPNPVLKLPGCSTCGRDALETLDVKRFVDYETLIEEGE